MREEASYGEERGGGEGEGVLALHIKFDTYKLMLQLFNCPSHFLGGSPGVQQLNPQNTPKQQGTTVNSL